MARSRTRHPCGRVPENSRRRGKHDPRFGLDRGDRLARCSCCLRAPLTGCLFCSLHQGAPKRCELDGWSSPGLPVKGQDHSLGQSNRWRSMLRSAGRESREPDRMRVRDASGGGASCHLISAVRARLGRGLPAVAPRGGFVEEACPRLELTSHRASPRRNVCRQFSDRCTPSGLVATRPHWGLAQRANQRLPLRDWRHSQCKCAPHEHFWLIGRGMSAIRQQPRKAGHQSSGW